MSLSLAYSTNLRTPSTTTTRCATPSNKSRTNSSRSPLAQRKLDLLRERKPEIADVIEELIQDFLEEP